MQRTKYWFSFLLSAGMSCFANASEAENKIRESMTDNTPYRLQFTNNSVYQKQQQGFNNAIVWIPLWQQPSMVAFAQLNQLNRFNSLHGYGANLGLRWLTNEQDWLFGVHGGYRQQSSETHNTYHQALFGAEMRTDNWHGYANAYLPLNQQKRETEHDLWLAQNANDSTGFYNVLTKQGTEQALQGVDGAVGYRFFKPFNARLYIGGYHYQASGVKSISGPRAKLTFDLYNAFDRFGHSTILNKISFEAQVQHDAIYKTQWYAGITFSMSIGKKQRLSGLQQYMQSEIAEDYAMVIRPNDDVAPSVYKNADGSALSLAYVDSAANLSNAITNHADVIAVRGSVANLDKVTLQDNQVLTGGTYTLSNGVQINPGSNGQLRANTGQNLIQVGKSNHIENISLQADSDKAVIINDQSSSFGNLTINNITANAGVSLKVTDGSSDANLSLTGNTFNMGNVSSQKALQVLLDAGTMKIAIDNNTFNFGEGDSNMAVAIQSDISGNNRIFTIDSIDNNTFNFAQGSDNSAIRLNVSDNHDYFGKMTVSSLQNNQINFADGDSNYGLNANVSSLAGSGLLTINKLINNNLNYGSGNNNVGFYIGAGDLVGDGAAEINAVYGNHVDFSGDNSNVGFRFVAGNDPNDVIIVNVDSGTQGLAQANNGTSVSTTGNIVINPEA